jgi:hypothetical protein
MVMFRTAGKYLLLTVAYTFIGCVAVFILVGVASSLDYDLGKSTRDGNEACLVSSMLVEQQLNKPSTTKNAMLHCDNGEWGFVSLSARGSIGWQQPQELLDSLKVGQSFNCERYRKRGYSGLQKEYLHYKNCTLI